MRRDGLWGMLDDRSGNRARLEVVLQAGGPADRSLRRDPRLWLGGLLLALYALPLFWPPGPAAPARVAEGAPLLARLFPGVPGTWVVLRLLALAAGAAFVARALPGPPIALPEAAESHEPPGRRVELAVFLALLQVAALPFVGALAPWGQLGWVAALALPPLLLHSRTPVAPGARLPVASAGLVVSAWLVAWGALAWRSPRSALPVDLWHALGWLQDAVASQANVLVASGQPGVANTFMLALGYPVYAAAGGGPALETVQVLGALWIAASALLLGVLAARCVGPPAAPVAMAVFLASPFVLLLAYSPAPFGIYTTLAAALAVLLVAFHRSGSLATLTALGAVAGLAATTAYLYPAVAVAGVLVALELVRRPPRRAWLHWTLPLLAFVAAAGPTLPGPEAFQALVGTYVDRHGEWAVLEDILLGQRSPFQDTGRGWVWLAGRPGPFDIALGSLLSPFAAPRSPFRLWADAIFDPLGAALAAVGLALCLGELRRHAGSRWLLGLLALSLLPASVASAYDRASLTRNLLLPLAMGGLAAVGFEGLRRRLLPRGDPRRWGLALAGLILVSGFALFEGVNPRLLRASASALHVEALGAGLPPGGAAMLEYGRPFRLDWLGIEDIGRELPPQPVPTRPYAGSGSLVDEAPEPIAELLLWSPALDGDEGISRVLCSRWPGTALYRLVDRTGFASAWAARVAGPGWRPALPAERWERLSCEERLAR